MSGYGRRMSQATTHDGDLVAVIAGNVRQAMRERGMTGVKLARNLDMSQQAWSRRETGQTALTVDELWLVADELHREPGTFFVLPIDPLDSGAHGARSSTDRASDYGSVVRCFPRSPFTRSSEAA